MEGVFLWIFFVVILVLRFFGLEFFMVFEDVLFVNVGECMNVIGLVKFCRLIKEE